MYVELPDAELAKKKKKLVPLLVHVYSPSAVKPVFSPSAVKPVLVVYRYLLVYTFIQFPGFCP